MLLDDRLVTVAPDGRATERERRVLKILRPRGANMQRLLPATPRTKSLITSMPGASVRMATNTPSRIRRCTMRHWGNGESSTMTFGPRAVTPPGADPGGVDRLRGRAHGSPITAPRKQTWDFQRDIPGVRWILEVDLPPGWNHYERGCIMRRFRRPRWRLTTGAGN